MLRIKITEDRHMSINSFTVPCDELFIIIRNSILNELAAGRSISRTNELLRLANICADGYEQCVKVDHGDSGY